MFWLRTTWTENLQLFGPVTRISTHFQSFQSRRTKQNWVTGLILNTLINERPYNSANIYSVYSLYAPTLIDNSWLTIIQNIATTDFDNDPVLSHKYRPGLVYNVMVTKCCPLRHCPYQESTPSEMRCLNIEKQQTEDMDISVDEADW